MTRSCYRMLGHDVATCPICKLALANPAYDLWLNRGTMKPRRQIDPNKPRLPKGVPP